MTQLQNIFNVLALNLLHLFTLLSYVLTIHMGYDLGWLAAHTPNKHTKVVRTNPCLCFSKLSDKQINPLALKHWKLFVCSVIGCNRVWIENSNQILSFVHLESVVPQEIVSFRFINFSATLLVLRVTVTLWFYWPWV